MSKKPSIKRPDRDPDHYSKRHVPYWWSPEWVRGTSHDGISDMPIAGWIPLNDGRFVSPCDRYGKIHAVKEKGTVNLYMKSKEGHLTFIQGSIQEEFKRWHEDRMIDYMLFGMDPDDILSNEE